MRRAPRLFAPPAASTAAGHRPRTEPSANCEAAVSSNADIAWLLADTTTCLASRDRAIVFVELGCGEYFLAIERILKAMVSNQVALPSGVLARLTDWLDGHVGSPEEPRLRELIADIPAQRREAG